MTIDFFPSQSLTVGVELELQLLDRESLDLIDGIMPLIDIYPGSPYVKPEFIQNTVEITSKIGRNTAEVHTHLNHIATGLKQNCLKLGMQICGAGTHPFCKRLALITPFPRFRQMEKSTGYLSHNQITFATHVHVGMDSADKTIKVMNRLKPYLPLLIALSASSPFWRGYKTGFVSYRQLILAASRSYGIPPSFKNWQQFSEFYDAAVHAKMLETMNDIHWDIRPRPHLGTVEIRVMDAQATIADAMALASLVRTLVAFLQEEHDSEASRLPHTLPWWFEKNNHYQASHLGFAANYIYRDDGAAKPLIAVCHDVIQSLEPTARALGEKHYLEQIKRKVERNELGYSHQLRVYQQTGALKEVVASLVGELARENNKVPPCDADLIDKSD